MRTLVAVLLLAPALALAQDAAPQLQEDPRAARFRDVERGFFVGFDSGLLWLSETPNQDPETFRLAGAGGGSAGGLGIGAVVGVDLGPHWSIALFVNGANGRANSNYGGFSVLSGGVDARGTFWSWRDRNDWERLFLYAHVRVGYLKSYPEGLFSAGELLAQPGVGIEYFTKLRHFSIGAALDSIHLTERSWEPAGFALYPTVRYTF